MAERVHVCERNSVRGGVHAGIAYSIWAAYMLVSQFDSQHWPHKLVVFLLAITVAMEEGIDYQRYCTLAGIDLAMILLAASLGSRA